MKLNFFLAILIQLFTFYSGKINAANNSGMAVAIVDMQTGFYEQSKVSTNHELINLVTHQRKLIKWAIKNDIPVIIWEYSGFKSTDPSIMKLLGKHKHVIITKYTDGAFDSEKSSIPSLKILKEWNVDTIIIAGINGCCCIKDTAIGAVKAGFDVMTSSDLVGNINKKRPVYPDHTWFFNDHKFVVFKNLSEIID